MPNEQLALFPPASAKPKPLEEPAVAPVPAHEPTQEILLPPAPSAPSTPAPLSATAPLSAAITAYHAQMERQNLSHHTIQAFGLDLNLFQKHVGATLALNAITTATIEEYLHWLLYERGVPCKPKSHQRRLTTLKVFFAWLTQTEILRADPAAPVSHIPVTAPLPEILYADQVTTLVNRARELFRAEKSDPRPLVLVTLLLSTGIKKAEVMALRLSDIDAADPKNAVLFIRYDDAKKRFKERKLKVSPEFATTLPQYIAHYQPQAHLFECTPRNLEYVLADLAQATGLGNTVSFESLRWTCAVQDFKSGMADEHLRMKLGLSKMTWEEDRERLKRLAGQAL